MSVTISSPQNDGVTLTAASPTLSITNAGAINANQYFAVYATEPVIGTVNNAGTIYDSQRSNTTVLLRNGGAVYNAASGYINGTNGFAVVLASYNGAAGANITNAGLIAGRYEAIITNFGYLTNLADGATITNLTGGTIKASNVGIYERGLGSDKVVNAGNILGASQGIIQDDDTQGVVINQRGGTITASAGNGLAIEQSSYQGGYNYDGTAGHPADTIINAGLISSNAYAVFNSYGTDYISNSSSGVIIGGSVALRLSNTAGESTIINAGSIASSEGAGGVAVYAVYAALNFVEEASGHITGIVDGAADENNILELGSSASAGSISGIGTQYVNFGSIVIDPGATWTLEGNSAALASGTLISGFTNLDTLVLDGVTASGATYVAGTGLIVTNAVNLETETINISGDFAHDSLIILNEAQGTEFLLCFLQDTKILTPRGDVKVQDLAIGDVVATRFGGAQRIKWLGRQSFARAFIARDPARLPVKISAGALGRGLPLRDLFVSPGHSMLLGETLVLARQLVNGITITQDEAPERIDYVQIELEAHDCVMAEGSWSESFADAPGLRGKYHNAAEFWTLYPDYVTPAHLRLCAPRPERGAELEAALAPVVTRAAARAAVGALRGCLDWIGPDGLVEGWAQDEANKLLPVTLEILHGGVVLGTVLACHYRSDLAQAGFGNGQCSFAFHAPAGLAPQGFGVRRAADGAALAPAFDLWERVA